MSTWDSSATGVAEAAGAEAADEGSESEHPRTTSMVATTRIKSTAPTIRRSMSKSIGEDAEAPRLGRDDAAFADRAGAGAADIERAERAGSEAREDGRAEGRSALRDAPDAGADGRAEERVGAADADRRGAGRDAPDAGSDGRAIDRAPEREGVGAAGRPEAQAASRGAAEHAGAEAVDAKSDGRAVSRRDERTELEAGPTGVS